MRIIAYLGSFICIAAGVYLLSFQSANSKDAGIAGSSWFEILAHGIGIYFIGKGLVVGALSWAQFGSKDCRYCRLGMPERASVCGHCGRVVDRESADKGEDKFTRRFEQ